MQFQSDVKPSVLLVCAILLPPLAVLFKTDCSVHFFINLFLFFLGVIPGILHAIYICFYSGL